MENKQLLWHNRMMASDPQYAERFNKFMASKQYAATNPVYGRDQAYQAIDPNLNVSPDQVNAYAADGGDGMWGDMNQKMAQAYQQEATRQMGDMGTKPYWYRQADLMMRSGNPYLVGKAQDLRVRLKCTCLNLAHKVLCLTNQVRITRSHH